MRLHHLVLAGFLGLVPLVWVGCGDEEKSSKRERDDDKEEDDDVEALPLASAPIPEVESSIEGPRLYREVASLA